MARVVNTFVSVFGNIYRATFFPDFSFFCDRVVYPFYLSSPQRFGLTALEDQQCAGALMWNLRHHRLLDRRSRFRGAFTFSPLVAGLFDSAIRVAGHCRGAPGRAEDGGCLNVRPLSFVTELSPSGRRRAPFC